MVNYIEKMDPFILEVFNTGKKMDLENGEEIIK